jgi:hypothetical protein
MQGDSKCPQAAYNNRNAKRETRLAGCPPVPRAQAKAKAKAKQVAGKESWQGQVALRKGRREKKKKPTYLPTYFFCKKSQKARPIFFVVFLNSPHRETPKNVIKRFSRKNRFWTFGQIFCKNFSTRFFLQNVFCSVFELPSLKNTRKCDKTKKAEEKLTSKFLSKFWEKFSARTFCQNIFMVFSNSPCRETPKTVLKKTATKKKEKGRYLPTRFIICQIYVAFFFFSLAPLGATAHCTTHNGLSTVDCGLYSSRPGAPVAKLPNQAPSPSVENPSGGASSACGVLFSRGEGR